MAGEAQEHQEQETFNDDFEAAFIDAVEDKPLQKETAEPPADEKKEEKQEEPKQEEAKQEEPKEEEAKQEEPPKQEEPKKEENPLEATVQALQREIEQLKQSQEKAPEPTPEQRAAEEAKQQQDNWYKKDFTEDWPDIAKAINQVAEQLREEMKQHVTAVAQQMQPVVKQSANNAFLTELRAIHPDFDSVREGFIGWVKSQPTAVSNAYANVVKTGTAADVASLVTVYKESTKKPTPKDEKKEQEKSEKLRNMEDVGSRETSTHHEVEASDYDGAFDEAIKAV